MKRKKKSRGEGVMGSWGVGLRLCVFGLNPFCECVCVKKKEIQRESEESDSHSVQQTSLDWRTDLQQTQTHTTDTTTIDNNNK